MAWNKPKDKFRLEDGTLVDARHPDHPRHKATRKPYTRRIPLPKSPNRIPYHHWIVLVDWIPGQIEFGNFVDRQMLAELCKVQEQTVAMQKWLHAIHDHWQGVFEWEVDPNYNAKRGAKIKRLVPK